MGFEVYMSLRDGVRIFAFAEIGVENRIVLVLGAKYYHLHALESANELLKFCLQKDDRDSGYRLSE